MTKTTVLLDLVPGHRLNDRRLRQQVELLQELAEEVGDEGSVWVHTHNRPTQRGLLPWAAMLTEAVHKAGFMRLRNVLIFHHPGHIKGPLHPTYSEVLWFVPNNRKYHFNKDAVREPHVFKDLEWGHREFGPTSYRGRARALRYSKGGRDPGNVFYEVKRSETGTVTSIHPVHREVLYERIVKATTHKGWTVRTNLDEPFRKAIQGMDRNVSIVERVP